MKIVDFIKREKCSIFSLILTLLCVFIGGGVMMAEVVTVTEAGVSAQAGQGRLNTQMPGSPTTVSGIERAEGGMGMENLIQPDIDEDITLIATDESVLDTIKRRVKRQVRVDAFEVDHYMIDEKRNTGKSTAAVTEAKTTAQFAIPMSDADAKLFYDYTTALVKGVKGYAADGTTQTDAFLMLYCVGKNDSGYPKFKCVNGPKAAASQSEPGTPAIPLGSEIILLGSAGYETQERIEPNTIIPEPKRVYLQKRLCNSIVSDYFESQKKRIPFQKAQIAEASLRQYRLECCRTDWVGVKSKFVVKAQDKTLGDQNVYTSEGIRWQIKRSYELIEGKIILADIVGLAKFKFTGYNCSKQAIWIMGKDLLADIQTIDMTLHKDISMTDSEAYGIKCTKLKTVFGSIELVHDPVLDRLGYSKCGALLDADGLVRYWRKNETQRTEKVEGEEAKRDIVMCIESLCLKGFSHVWVDGSGVAEEVSSQVRITPVSTLPTSAKVGDVIIMKADITGDDKPKKGDILEYDGSAWVAYTGTLLGETA